MTLCMVWVTVLLVQSIRSPSMHGLEDLVHSTDLIPTLYRCGLQESYLRIFILMLDHMTSVALWHVQKIKMGVAVGGAKRVLLMRVVLCVLSFPLTQPVPHIQL